MAEKPLVDPQSETWRAVREWAEERLRVHRALLEAPGTDLVETEYARGAIQDLKSLMALANRSPSGIHFHIEDG